jgi:hypothetical protein
VKIAGSVFLAVVAAYVFLLLATEAPGVLALLIVGSVLAVDGLLLVLAARRRSLSVSVWCAVVAVLAALAQACWVYLPFGWDVLPPNSDGIAWFGSALAVALTVAGRAAGSSGDPPVRLGGPDGQRPRLRGFIPRPTRRLRCRDGGRLNRPLIGMRVPSGGESPNCAF